MRNVDFLDKGARAHPDRLFCVDERGGQTYREMAWASVEIARALTALGTRDDTKVAVLSPNCGAVFACIYGIELAGAIRVPVNYRNGIEENLGILADFDVDVLLYHASVEGLARDLRHRLARELKLACIDGDGEDGVRTLAARAPADIVSRPYDPLKVVSIYPTGGTTGKPRGVVHTGQNWFARTANFVAHLPVDAPAVHLVVAPLTHGAGSVALSLTAQGATHVILDKFDPERVMAAIGQHAVTHLFLPPTALYMLLAHPRVRDHDYRSLRYFIYGAAPSSPEKIAAAIDIFGEVMTHSYAQTEALSIAYLHPSEHGRAGGEAGARMRSCGRPCVLTDLRISRADGTLAESGEPGEIEVRGAAVMAGYYNDAAATQHALREGWLRTGDVGYLDDDGYLYLVDRSKDLIISGGFNVYPAEVERVAVAHPDVQDCAVVGVPDPKWGEAVLLVVQARSGRAIDVAELHAFCRARLGGVKSPKAIEVWEQLPRSTAGKVLKRDIRARFWDGSGRKI